MKTDHIKKPSQFSAFMRGVFWTLFIGMLVHISAPHAQTIIAQRETASVDKEIGYSKAQMAAINKQFKKSMDELAAEVGAE